MLAGLNHITLAVSDLPMSFKFYQGLGFIPEVSWAKGAYLTCGNVWLCLSLGEVDTSFDYSHLAFSIDKSAIEPLRQYLESLGSIQWKENSSEGDSIYFLDPDGHKLEAHVGSLKTRLQSLEKHPYAGLIWHRKR